MVLASIMTLTLASSDLEKQAAQRIQQMELLESKSSNYVIEFSDVDYQNLVLKNPRNFDVVMLFNINQNCEHCAEVEAEFQKMVYSFVKSRGQDINTSEKKIYFGVLYFNNKKEIQSIFKDHGFTTVPYLAVSAMDLKRDSSKGKFYATEDQWLVSSQEVFGATKIIDFVNNHLKTDVSLKIPFSEIMFKNMIGMVIISMLFSFVKSVYPILLN